MTRAPAPCSTYRLQFAGRRFTDVRTLVPYLHALGAGALYASPLLQAVADSTHGYDGTDPTRLHEEFGTDADFTGLAADLRAAGMGLLLDIVPNHMASSAHNPWWRDVLEHGPSSPYASYFDIDWRPGGAAPGQLLRPVLGDRYGAVLERGELKLAIDRSGLHVNYFDRKHPLDPQTYDVVLDAAAVHGGRDALAALANAFGALPSRDAGGEEAARRRDESSRLKKELWAHYENDPQARAALDAAIRELNGTPGRPGSFDRLDALLLKQPYRLVYWLLATRELNYRRFFDISDLVGVRVELPAVFDAMHVRILEWVSDGRVTGLRIDHVDGLADPAGYLERLQQKAADALRAAGAAPPAYVVVEKILGEHEPLPPSWPVAGTTGYDFAVSLTALFCDPSGLRQLDAAYREFTGIEDRFSDVVYRKKKQLMAQLFAGEVVDLAAHLGTLARDDRHARDIATQHLADAVTEVTAAISVYRTYTRSLDVAPEDRTWIEEAVGAAHKRLSVEGRAALDFLRRVLLLERSAAVTDATLRDRLEWVIRWQQFTGPVMAKGVEDSALYHYNRLLSLNDVGGDPGAGALGASGFHARMRERIQHWPATMNATSTHDTKRSEDVRARLNVLSELPAEWAACVADWARINRRWKSRVRGRGAPDPNEEYFLYQTLVGAWPLDDAELPAFGERLAGYIRKALREAREHSSWVAPNTEYEEAVQEFAANLLNRDRSAGFWRGFRPFQQRVALHGAVNALAQLTIKLGAPGVPDFYQGTELWDFSLVDPDNRRPVDFTARAAMLADLDTGDWSGVRLQQLVDEWQDGRIKLHVTSRGLRLRRVLPELFAAGAYDPLAATGKQRGKVLAFARHLDGEWVAFVATVRSVGSTESTAMPRGDVWGTTALRLPPGAPGHWRNILSEEVVAARPAGGLALADVLRDAPVAILRGA